MSHIRQYQNVQVMTADRVRLVIMLYEGVVRFNKCAQQAIVDGDIEARSNYINRSLDIVNELSNTLNMEAGGEIAKNLARLYEFATHQLAQANLKNDPAMIEAVTRVINELKGGWQTIASEKPAPSATQFEQRAINYGI